MSDHEDEVRITLIWALLCVLALAAMLAIFALSGCGGVVVEHAPPADCVIPSSFTECGPRLEAEQVCYPADGQTYWMFLAGGEAYHQSIGKGAATPTLCHIGVDGDATIGWHR